MMHHSVRTCALVLLAACVGLAHAGPPKKNNKTNKSTSQKRGETSELRGITWYRDLDKALEQAKGSAADDDDRPVYLLRVLGDLDGFT